MGHLASTSTIYCCKQTYLDQRERGSCHLPPESRPLATIVQYKVHEKTMAVETTDLTRGRGEKKRCPPAPALFQGLATGSKGIKLTKEYGESDKGPHLFGGPETPEMGQHLFWQYKRKELTGEPGIFLVRRGPRTAHLCAGGASGSLATAAHAIGSFVPGLELIADSLIS